MPHKSALTPRLTKLIWLAAAAAAAGGLAFRFGQLDRIPGLAEAILSAGIVRILLITAAGLFALSQMVMVWPVELLGERHRRWWPNGMVIIAAVVWRWLDPGRERLILDLGAAYILAMGAWAIGRAGLHALAHGGGYGRFRPAGWRLLAGGLVLAAVGGTVLTLPVCWAGTYPASWDSTYPGQARGQFWMHWRDCTFTATAALTGTGLAVRDIGCEFSRTGQVVILVLMQIGGLAVLAIGASAGYRLRRLLGWGGPDDDVSPRGIRRLIIAVFALALIIEATGAGLLLPMWDQDTDANFADGGHRVLTSVFHAVSAFSNTGLTLTRESMIDYRDEWRLYAAILPLMVFGSIGGPVLVELIRRLIRRRGLGLGSLSYHSELTLAGSVMLIVVVGGLLIGIESTPAWQLRNPREDTPGRLMLPNATTQTATMPLATTRVQERVRTQRLATMDWPSRVKAAVLLSASARTTGMRTVRIDEASVSPASRFVLMGAMLVGGGVGGTAGGLRLGLFLLLIGALRFAWVSCGTQRDTAANRQPVIVIAAGLATALVLLVGLTGFVLAYRETGSPLACLFEATSACCNVGFSTGLTGQLSTQGRVVVMLAMLLGRVIPLAFLLRFLRVPLIPPALAQEPEPAVEADRPNPADNNTEVLQST